MSTGVELGIYPGLTQSQVVIQLLPPLQTLLARTLPLLLEDHVDPTPLGPPPPPTEGKGTQGQSLFLPGLVALPF